MVFSYLAGRLAANGGLSRTFLYSWVGVVVAANVGYSIVYRPLTAPSVNPVVKAPVVPAPAQDKQEQQ